MIFKRVLTICLCVLGLLVFANPEVEAGYWLNGKYYTKGVECDGEGTVKNIDKNMVSLACSIAPPVNEPMEIILVCRNRGGHIGTGRVFTQNLTFNVALSPGTVIPGNKGKVFFTAISNAAGVTAQTKEECDANPACVELRQYCININGNDSSWLPVDVIPIKMKATVATYFCDNQAGFQCPCDPSITPTAGNQTYRCATSLGAGKTPWTFDWNQTGGQLVPAAVENSSCELPNPETFEVGERRQYTCAVVP